MGRLPKIICTAVMLCAGFAVWSADVLARIGSDGLNVSDDRGGVSIDVPLTQAVPWRAFMMDDPARLILEFSYLEFQGAVEPNTEVISEIRVGDYVPGSSRFVAILREPVVIDSAEMRVEEDRSALLEVRLVPATAEEFRASVEHQDSDLREHMKVPAEQAGGPLVVAIDPGHGGIDPGAEASEMNEADLVLAFGRRLKEVLIRNGRFEVVMTRTEDVFVPLATRMSVARAAGADVFISLHADALPEDAGDARGVTVYTLADGVVDEATQQLAERHARDDILAGVDLAAIEDELTIVLMDLARRETMPRSENLATAIVEVGQKNELGLNSRPHRHGAFSVLKAADIPSVLIELGFLSNRSDRSKLQSDEWLDSFASSLAEALANWADAETIDAVGSSK